LLHAYGSIHIYRQSLMTLRDKPKLTTCLIGGIDLRSKWLAIELRD